MHKKSSSNLIAQLFANNALWAERVTATDPEFFPRLSAQQAPEFLWIGCADSRVPANEVVDLQPGELFVHRNVANLVVHTDLNCLSVLQYAVDVLKVKHVMVVGHYGCGGIRAAITGQRNGLIDNWLRHIQDLARQYQGTLDSLHEEDRFDAMCEINAICQAANVCETTIVQEAWARGQQLEVHGFVYSLKDGRMRDLGMNVSGANAPRELAAAAVAGVVGRYGI